MIEALAKLAGVSIEVAESALIERGDIPATESAQPEKPKADSPLKHVTEASRIRRGAAPQRASYTVELREDGPGGNRGGIVRHGQ